MTRTTAYTRRAPAIAPGSDEEPDHGAAAQQRVLRTAANSAPPPTTTAPASVFALGKAAKPPRKTGIAARLPVLDTKALKFETGVPLPERAIKRGGSRYHDVFGGLTKPGMSVVLPEIYAGSIGSAAKKRSTLGLGKYAVRHIGDGMVRLFRVE